MPTWLRSSLFAVSFSPARIHSRRLSGRKRSDGRKRRNGRKSARGLAFLGHSQSCNASTFSCHSEVCWWEIERLAEERSSPLLTSGTCQDVKSFLCQVCEVHFFRTMLATAEKCPGGNDGLMSTYFLVGGKTFPRTGMFGVCQRPVSMSLCIFVPCGFASLSC